MTHFFLTLAIICSSFVHTLQTFDTNFYYSIVDIYDTAQIARLEQIENKTPEQEEELQLLKTALGVGVTVEQALSTMPLGAGVSIVLPIDDLIRKGHYYIYKYGDEATEVATKGTSRMSKQTGKSVSEGIGVCKTQEHHKIPYANTRFNHQNHPLVKLSGTNLKRDKDNLMTLINHAGPHSRDYHDTVNLILDEYYQQVLLGNMTPEEGIRAAYKKIEEGIRNGSIKLYNNKEVILP